MLEEDPKPLLEESAVVNRYVAYMDILGWADKIKTDFGATLQLYNDLIRSAGDVRELTDQSPVLRVVSDSIFVVSEQLRPVLLATNLLLQAAGMNDCLLRGGIAFGRHCEVANESNLYVLSEALVSAARIEREVSHPCVALHPDIIQPSHYPVLASVPLLTPRLLLLYDGVWLVNPFDPFWLTSAVGRVMDMKKRHPEHSAKYNWFIGLYDTFTSGASMLPDSFDAGPSQKRWMPAHDEVW